MIGSIMTLNAFDAGILSFFNQFAHQWPLFDAAMQLLRDLNLMKGGVLILFYWYFWFKPDNKLPSRRESILTTYVACFAVLALAKIISETLPFRVRPFENPDIGFRIPYGMEPGRLVGWSAFPSDNASLFFALLTGLFILSKRTSLLLGIYIFIFVLFPRVYLGLHYPTDILGGIVLGTVVTALFHKEAVKRKITPPLLAWEAKHPASFYLFSFFVSYQMAVLFEDLRKMGGFALDAVRGLI